MDKYQIIDWNTDQVLSTSNSLSAAKRICRGFGHNGRQDGKWFQPIACVVIDEGEIDRDGNIVWGVVYNPQFKVEGGTR